MKRGIDDSPASTTHHHPQASKRHKKIQIEPQFPKLDQSDPVQARRIQQRRRMIQIGKNTVGYAEYVNKVPKHKRHPRTMKHPSTPDHTLNIGAKRWQGLVKAWRKALHQYDPPDLAKAFAATKPDSKKKQEGGKPTEEAHSSVQDRQLAEANTMLVDVSTGTQVPAEVSPSTCASNDDDAGGFDHHDEETTLEELARWEDSQQQMKSSNDFLLEDDDDSDDDLL